jgi:hypothetical protein
MRWEILMVLVFILGLLAAALPATAAQFGVHELGRGLESFTVNEAGPGSRVTERS